MIAGRFVLSQNGYFHDIEQNRGSDKIKKILNGYDIVDADVINGVEFQGESESCLISVLVQ